MILLRIHYTTVTLGKWATIRGKINKRNAGDLGVVLGRSVDEGRSSGLRRGVHIRAPSDERTDDGQVASRASYHQRRPAGLSEQENKKWK